MKRKVKCSHCGYTWQTGSKNEFLTCVSCQLKFRVKECLVK